MSEKCDYCGIGTVYQDEWGEYPGQWDYRCTTAECHLNVIADVAAEERWQDYLNDTYLDEYGDRQYY